MAVQTATEWRKLAFLAATVTCASVAIASVNYAVMRTESASDPASTKALAKSLREVARDHRHASIVFTPGTQGERVLKHLQVPLLSGADVLVLGQSDSDHMSETFFRSDVRFYNGFISNSYTAYQWEVFDQLAGLGETPQVVLWDVRSGYILQAGGDPTLEMSPTDGIWFAGPPFKSGSDVQIARPWWTQTDSLLSLRQTMHTFDALTAHTAAKGAANNGWLGSVSSGQIVPATEPSPDYRWLADGSRVDKLETADGTLAAQGKVLIAEATGRRKVNAEKVARFAELLDRMLAAGSRVIVYAPPVHPSSFADPAQKVPVAEYAAAVRGVTDARKIDFCDLTAKAVEIGCEPTKDFMDEIHLSRRCDERVVWQLANGCAPLAGGVLRGLVSRAVLARAN